MDREGVVIQTIHRWKESAGVPSGQQAQPSRTKPEQSSELSITATKTTKMQRPAGGDQRSERARTNIDNIQLDYRAPTGNTRQAALRLLSEVTP